MRTYFLNAPILNLNLKFSEGSKIVKMIDITEKNPVERIAEAEGKIKLKKETIKRIRKEKVEKGNVNCASKLVSIEAVKEVPHLLPLCHPIPLTGTEVEIEKQENYVLVRTKVKTIGKTGCEMEALMGTILALLNIWDMTKAYEKDEQGQYPWTKITDVRVTKKIKRKIE